MSLPGLPFFFVFPILIGQGSVMQGHPYYTGTKYFDSGEIVIKHIPLGWSGGLSPRLGRGSGEVDGLGRVGFSVDLPF